jgi:hypothetical protein
MAEQVLLRIRYLIYLLLEVAVLVALVLAITEVQEAAVLVVY